MKRLLIVLLFVPLFCFSQDWRIVDIVSKTKKELIYYLDNGESIERIKTNNPSIVHLIDSFEKKGYSLNKITHGTELFLEGNLPMTRQSQQWGMTNLSLDNNQRIMLWFRKEKSIN